MLFQSGLAYQPPLPPSPALAAGGPEAESMAAKVALLQRLAVAADRAARRRKLYGKGATAADAAARAAATAAAGGGEAGGKGAAGEGGGEGGGGLGAAVRMSAEDVIEAAMAAGQGLGLRLLEGLDAEEAAKALSSLNAEAQVRAMGGVAERSASTGGRGQVHAATVCAPGQEAQAG